MSADPRTSPRSRPSLRAQAGRGCAARRRSGVRGAVLALPPADLRVHPEPASTTTVAPRTSPRRCSCRRCVSCARPIRRSSCSRGSTRSPRTPASTSSAAASGARPCRSAPTTISPCGRRSLLSLVPTPDDAIESKQRLDDLRGAFGGLSDTHRRLLVMREFEGRSYDEIGDQLGMSRQMVESGLFRARRKLGSEYDELATGRRCEQIVDAIAAGTFESVQGPRPQRAPTGDPSPLPLPELPAPRDDGRRRSGAAEAAQRRRQARRAAAVRVLAQALAVRCAAGAGVGPPVRGRRPPARSAEPRRPAARRQPARRSAWAPPRSRRPSSRSPAPAAGWR